LRRSEINIILVARIERANRHDKGSRRESDETELKNSIEFRERTMRREKRTKGTELRFLIQRTKRRERRTIEGTKLFQSRLKQSSVQNGKETEIGSGISCLLGIISESRSAGVPADRDSNPLVVLDDGYDEFRQVDEEPRETSRIHVRIRVLVCRGGHLEELREARERKLPRRNPQEPRVLQVQENLKDEW
jgi:hypothetical protein